MGRAEPFRRLPGGTVVTRIALVTGANKGLGKEVSRQLAARGISVLLGSRDPERGERALTTLATLPDDGPSGGFFNDEGHLPW